MDLSEKESVPEEINGVKKCCADCKTTKTPLWRSGPAGPKTLCNACGIRYRKKRGRGEDVDLEKEPVEKKREKLGYSSSSTSMKTGSVKGGNLGEDLRARLMALGKEVVILQRQRSPMKRQRSNVDVKKMGEVEQAAILLMAMSCGSVFA